MYTWPPLISHPECKSNAHYTIPNEVTRRNVLSGNHFIPSNGSGHDKFTLTLLPLMALGIEKLKCTTTLTVTPNADSNCLALWKAGINIFYSLRRKEVVEITGVS